MEWSYYQYFFALVCVGHIIMVAFNLMSLFLENPFYSSSPTDTAAVVACSENTSVYIPGAGFSGFFYTLGRLSSMRINETTNESSPYEYYCFSSGCLALVTHLMGMNVDSAVRLAHGSRSQFISGNIGLYSVVEKFVDGLLFEDAKTDDAKEYSDDQCLMTNHKSNATLIQNHQLHDHLSRINVITTSWEDANLPSQSIRKPSSVGQLKQMLIQTTWM